MKRKIRKTRDRFFPPSSCFLCLPRCLLGINQSLGGAQGNLHNITLAHQYCTSKTISLTRKQSNSSLFANSTFSRKRIPFHILDMKQINWEFTSPSISSKNYPKLNWLSVLVHFWNEVIRNIQLGRGKQTIWQFGAFQPHPSIRWESAAHQGHRICLYQLIPTQKPAAQCKFTKYYNEYFNRYSSNFCCKCSLFISHQTNTNRATKTMHNCSANILVLFFLPIFSCPEHWHTKKQSSWL